MRNVATILIICFSMALTMGCLDEGSSPESNIVSYLDVFC